MHRSRICQIVVDVNDLDQGTEFWSQAVGGHVEPMEDPSADVYRRIALPDTDIRLLVQLVPEEKHCKTRVHIDIETDDVEAEVARLERLGATRKARVQERGYDFWVLVDPFDNEFCVLQPEFPHLLASGARWDAGP